MIVSNNTNIGELTFEELYQLHMDNKIYHDIQFNRIQAGAWDKHRKIAYITSVYDADIYSLIVLVDVDSCLAYARTVSDKVSISYYEKCKKNGYVYVILDGSNRIGSITEYLSNKFKIIKNGTEYDVSRIQFKSRSLPLSLVTRASKPKLHKLAIDLNSGENWNPQEKRNAQDKIISRLIRDTSISIYKTHIGNKISDVKVKRLGDQEILAQCLNHLQTDRFGGKSELDKLYDLDDGGVTQTTMTRFNNIFDIMCSMFGTKRNIKYRRSYFLYLFAVLNELKNAGFEINETHLMNFFNDLADEYERLYGDVTTTYYSPSKEQDYVWKNLMSSIDFEKEQKMAVLMTIVYSKLQSYLKSVKKSSRIIKTKPTSYVRYQIALRDDCRVRVNGCVNGQWFNPNDINVEYQTFKLHELVLSNKVHVDHIISLNKGGDDDISNMEFTLSEYNLWKSDKI